MKCRLMSHVYLEHCVHLCAVAENLTKSRMDASELQTADEFRTMMHHASSSLPLRNKRIVKKVDNNLSALLS